VPSRTSPDRDTGGTIEPRGVVFGGCCVVFGGFRRCAPGLPASHLLGVGDGGEVCLCSDAEGQV